MDLLATGTGYRWLSDLLGLAEGVLDQRTAESSSGRPRAGICPLSRGWRAEGALWDSTLRGFVSGLTSAAHLSELARAFLEGVGFEIRRCLDVLAETTPVREVVIAGHMTGHPGSLQMLADILDRTVQPYPAGSPAALGAALGALQLTASRPPSRHVDPAWPRRVHPSRDAHSYQPLYASYLAKTRGTGEIGRCNSPGVTRAMNSTRSRQTRLPLS